MSQFGLKLAQFVSLPNKFPFFVQIFDNVDELLKAFNITNEQQVKDVKEQKCFQSYITQGSYNTQLALHFDYKYDGSVKTLQECGATIVKKLTGLKIYEADVQFPLKFDQTTIGQIVNGMILENYQYNAQNDQEKWFKPVTCINIVKHANFNIDSQEFQFFLRSGECNILCRQLGMTRANIATPQYMMEIAKQIAAETNTKLNCVVGKELEKQGMNLIYGVGKGSNSEPCIVNLYYNGNPQSNDVVAFVGKGICFDSGGLNIKMQMMEKMYQDKCGACAVLCAFRGIALLKLPINISCTLGLAENAPDANAYRPSDIIKSLNGLTVEIGNTDAEGRLVLADAMTYTQNLHKGNVKQLIELSTLTGACMVALGLETGGLFSNDDNLAKLLYDISTQCNEQLWRLPITQEHKTSIKGEHADLNNIGKAPYGGACTAAAFLECFVDKDVQWSHIDIAGPASKLSKNTTGFGVRILMEYALKNSKL